MSKPGHTACHHVATTSLSTIAIEVQVLMAGRAHGDEGFDGDAEEPTRGMAVAQVVSVGGPCSAQAALVMVARQDSPTHAWPERRGEISTRGGEAECREKTLTPVVSHRLSLRKTREKASGRLWEAFREGGP